LFSISAYAEEPLSFSDADLGRYRQSGETVVPDHLKNQKHIQDSQEYKDAAKAEEDRKKKIDEDAAKRAEAAEKDRRLRSEQQDKEAADLNKSLQSHRYR
jgi:hypothetical protein